MQRVQAGDAAAFEALYKRTAPRVIAYLDSMVRQRATAEDLAQMTFLKIHRARDTYATGSPVTPWVLAIARRTCIDHWRKQSRNPATPGVAEQMPEVAAAPNPRMEVLQGQGSSAASDMLAHTLAGMPAAQSEALMLLKVQGLSLVEAAAVAGTSVGAMKLRAHRAYEHIRKALGARKSGVQS